MMKHPTALATLLLASLTQTACTASSSEADSATSEELIGGTTTFADPEVGFLAFPTKPGWIDTCTATLVSPRVIVTAAHCVDFGTKNTGALNGGKIQFAIQTKSSSHAYDGVAFRSFGTDLGEHDLALVRLAAPGVPANVAAPSHLFASPNTLPDGTKVDIYGYGCTSLDHQDQGQAVKRVYVHTLGNGISALCPGDSGGPTLYRNGVYRVNSFYKEGTIFGIGQENGFANVPVHHAELQKQIDAWR